MESYLVAICHWQNIPNRKLLSEANNKTFFSSTSNSVNICMLRRFVIGCTARRRIFQKRCKTRESKRSSSMSVLWVSEKESIDDWRIQKNIYNESHANQIIYATEGYLPNHSKCPFCCCCLNLTIVGRFCIVCFHTSHTQRLLFLKFNFLIEIYWISTGQDGIFERTEKSSPAHIQRGYCTFFH